MEKSKIKKLKSSLVIIFCSLLLGLIIWRIEHSIFKKPPKIQNFILISIDDLRADRLGCYGNDRDVSPYIDTLARQGTQFLFAFTPYPWTPPSHISMFTSLYPYVFDIPLDPKIQTTASILNKYGYKTAAFTGGGFMSAGYGILNGFEEYNDKVYSLRGLEKKTKQWLKNNRKKKFFLFLHTYYVHLPFAAPKKYFNKYADPDYSGPIKNNSRSTSEFMKAANRRKITVTSEDVQRMFDIYDSQIKRVDKFVCLIVKTLKDFNLTNKTMLIITSDHGEQFYEYKHFGHSSRTNPFADISTRVPLIIYCPMLSHNGKVAQLVELVDIPPTILEVSGIKTPKSFQGQSLFPILDRRPHLFFKKEIFYRRSHWVGTRTKRLKLTLDYNSGKIQLYDLLKDPTESKNISKKFSQANNISSLINKINVFQEKNEDLRKKLCITKIKLAGGLPSVPFSFDNDSVFLVSFDDSTFIYKKKNSPHVASFEEREFRLEEGRYEKGLFLEPKKKISFPLEVPILSNSGAIEFWIKIKKGASSKQKLFEIVLVGKGCSIVIQSHVIWIGRTSINLVRCPNKNNQTSIRLTSRYSYKWRHIRIAWEPDEVFLLVDGALVSRININSGNFFRQRITTNIEVSGENCVLDEFRISNISRLSRVLTETKKLDEEVLRRLKSLGYID